jgi:hypothetical protein
MKMIRVLTEEGHYTIKRVNKLPKVGNANWLYAYIGDVIKEFHRWDAFKKKYEIIKIGTNTNDYNQLINLPIAITNTSELLNDGEDGTDAFALVGETSLQDVITVDRRGDEVEFIYPLTNGVKLRGGFSYFIDAHTDTLESSKYYIYGDWDTADGEIKRDFVRLNSSDDTLDPTFDIGTGTNEGSFPYAGTKFSVAPNGKLFISGAFTEFNGVGANRIVSLNNDGSINTDFNYGTGFDNFTLSSKVNIAGTHIYITGFFSLYNGGVANRLAKLSIADGTNDPSFIVGSGFNSTTVDLLVNADESVFVTGYFTAYKGVGANKITKLLPNGDRDVTFQSGSGFNTFSNQPNFLFRNSAGILICYGYFTSYNGTNSNRIIALNDDGTVNNTYDFGSGFSDYVLNIKEKTTGGYYVYSTATTYKGTPITQVTELDNAFKFVRSLENVQVLVGDSDNLKVGIAATDEEGAYLTPINLTSNYGRVANKLTFSKTTGKSEYLIGDLEDISENEIMPRRLIEELVNISLSLQKIVTAVAYNILPEDLGYTIFLNSEVAATVTLNSGLPANFECKFYNLGTGTVKFLSGTAVLGTPDGIDLTTDKSASVARVMATSVYKLKGELV